MSSIVSKKPFDEAELLARFKGKIPLLRKLETILAAQTPRLLAEIRDGIDGGNGQRIAHAAHTLKGSLAQLGAMGASELARELEESGEAGALSRAEVLVSQLQNEASEVQCALSRLTRSSDL